MADAMVSGAAETDTVLASKDSAERHVSGHETAAILLMTFGEDEAADILSRLKPVEVQALGEAMFEISNVSEEDINLVFDRFVEQARSRTAIGYRADKQIKSMLAKALGTSRASNILSRITPQQDQAELQQLKWMSAQDIAEMVVDEHPQMIAVVLSFLDPEIAGEVLQRLDADLQDDVVFRVATTDAISANAIADIEALLSRQDQKPDATVNTKIGGTSEAAAIMNNVEKSSERRIINALLKRDKVMAQAIEDEMFIFADLVTLEDKSLGTLIRLIENKVLILALKGAETDLAEKMFSCMSKRAAESIKDEMADMGPVSKDDVIMAQKQIVAQARRLAEDGSIILEGQSNDFV